MVQKKLDYRKERAANLLQATILGRVERLMGSGFEANPYPPGSELWEAFLEGYRRELDNPLMSTRTMSCDVVRQWKRSAGISRPEDE